MTPTQAPTRGDLELLRNEVTDLAKAYKQSRKRLLISYVLIGLVSLLTLGVGVLAIVSINAAAEAKRSQTVSCQNANETREGQRLWVDFVLNISAGDSTDTENQARAAILDWTHELFAPRDCSQLNKHYEIPKPPDIAKILSQGKNKDKP